MKQFMKYIVVTAMILVLCVQAFGMTVLAGNSQSTATEVKAGKDVYYGTIRQGGVGDWYFIKMGVSDGYHTFTLHNESGTGNVHLKVYSSRGEEILHVGDYTSAGEEVEGTERLLCNLTYYVHVYMENNATGNYYFKISKFDDVIGNSKETRKPIKLDEVFESTIDGEEDTDCYMFTTLDSQQEYLVTLKNLNGATGIFAEIYSSRDERVCVMGDLSGDGGEASEIVTLNANATYYAIVSKDSGGNIGSYNFEVSQCVDGHTVGDEWIESKKPTCTEEGEQVRQCTRCKKVMKTKSVKATGHTVEEWEIKEPSTWKSLGKKEAPCTVCGDIQTKRDWSKVWMIPAGVLGGILVLVGIVNYFRSFGK